jgi:hypothetical protein
VTISLFRSIAQYRAAYRAGPKWTFWLGVLLAAFALVLMMSWMSGMDAG